jgi:hypothetical protein
VVVGHDFVPEQVWGRDACQARIPCDRAGVRVCNLPRKAHGLLEILIAACVWCAEFCACQWRAATSGIAPEGRLGNTGVVRAGSACARLIGTRSYCLWCNRYVQAALWLAAL